MWKESTNWNSNGTTVSFAHVNKRFKLKPYKGENFKNDLVVSVQYGEKQKRVMLLPERRSVSRKFNILIPGGKQNQFPYERKGNEFIVHKRREVVTSLNYKWCHRQRKALTGKDDRGKEAALSKLETNRGLA